MKLERYIHTVEATGSSPVLSTGLLLKFIAKWACSSSSARGGQGPSAAFSPRIKKNGDIAQLVEHCIRIAGVRSSNLLISTNIFGAGQVAEVRSSSLLKSTWIKWKKNPFSFPGG
jgi:hypothetical protein